MNIAKRIKNAIQALKGQTVELNDKELLEWLGISTTNYKAVSEVTYYTCLKLLAETLGKMPLKYYQQTERGRIRADPTTAGILILKLMDRETWLTANQCLDYGFVDEIMSEQHNQQYTNSYNGMWLTDELRQQAIEEKRNVENKKKEARELIEDLDMYGV